MNFLHHQLGKVIEHISQRIAFGTAPCRHVMKNRSFTGVEFDDVGHVTVNCLVIGYAGAGRIGNGDLARPVKIEHTGNAKP